MKKIKVIKITHKDMKITLFHKVQPAISHAPANGQQLAILK